MSKSWIFGFLRQNIILIFIQISNQILWSHVNPVLLVLGKSFVKSDPFFDHFSGQTMDKYLHFTKFLRYLVNNCL